MNTSRSAATAASNVTVYRSQPVQSEWACSSCGSRSAEDVDSSVCDEGYSACCNKSRVYVG